MVASDCFLKNLLIESARLQKLGAETGLLALSRLGCVTLVHLFSVLEP